MEVWIALIGFSVIIGVYLYLLSKILPFNEYVLEKKYLRCKENIQKGLEEINNCTYITYNTGDVVCFNPDGKVRFVYDHLGKKWR